MRRNSGFELDVEAEMRKANQKAVFSALRMEAVETVGALFAVGRAVADHGIGKGKDAVSDGDSGFLHASPTANAEKRVVKKVRRRLIRAAAQAA